MLRPKPDKEWEKLGKKDPFYSSVNLDKFHQDNLDEKTLFEFMDSGRDHVEYIMEVIRAKVQKGFSPTRVFDFGCGMGRCTIPLARICPEVVGVDISESMLEVARKYCIEQSITNLVLMKSSDDLSDIHGDFDLIHSSFVFQHIPCMRGEKIFKRLIDLLSENGVAAIQFLFHREVSNIVKVLGYMRKKAPLFHNIVNLLYGQPFFEPLAEKNVYDLNSIFKILHETACGNFHLRIFHNRNHLDAILFFQKKRDKSVPFESFVAGRPVGSTSTVP